MDKEWDIWLKEPLPSKKKIDLYNNLLKNIFTKYQIDNNNMNVLEIGAGHGLKTIWLNQLFKTMHCIEPNESLYKGLKKNILSYEIDNVTTENTSIEKFNNYKTFDMIIMINCYLFVENKKRILNKCIDMINENNYILFMEPSYYMSVDEINSNINKRLIESIYTICNNKHIELVYYGIIEQNIIYVCKKKPLQGLYYD